MNDLDNDRLAPVIHGLLAIAETHPQHLQSTYSLLGQLYLQSQQCLAAFHIYELAIASFPNALWAKWGMIKSQFLNGDWDNCASLLNTLLQTKATRDKALEWLACVAFTQHDYSAASEYLSRILTCDLSLQATKLKSHLYCLQSQIDQAISLLNDKCNANHMLKDKFKELTFDLLRCVIKKGSQLYANNQFEQSMYYYYKAHQLYPKSPTFGLNLLTCMHHCRQVQYKEALAQQLFDTLNGTGLKSYQIKRLRALQAAFNGLFKRTHPLRRYRIDVAVP